MKYSKLYPQASEFIRCGRVTRSTTPDRCGECGEETPWYDTDNHIASCSEECSEKIRTGGKAINARPPGHITDLIRQLEKWRFNREAKMLDVKPLKKAVRYLVEYRDLLAELRKGTV